MNALLFFLKKDWFSLGYGRGETQRASFLKTAFAFFFALGRLVFPFNVTK